MATAPKAITVVVDSELQKLVPGFIEGWKAQIQKIRTALEKSDFESIRTSGHDMKGIGKTCGFDFITQLGQELETAARDMCREKVKESLGQLTTYLQSIEVIYV